MHLLLLITDLKVGGTPTVVRELALRLKSKTINVQVACLSEWGPVADEIKNAGITVTSLNARGPRDLNVLARLIKLIQHNQIDTVFSFLVHANLMAAAASFLVQNVRWIQSIQTTQPTPGWHWWVQRLAQRAAEKVVVPSQSVATVAEQWAGVPLTKTEIIPNAIDLNDWANFQSPVPRQNPRPYPVTFLGRLDPIKDIPTLLSAVSHLNPLVQLHIYGDGSQRERLQIQIESLQVPVTMHGSVASPQAALGKSGMLILPSLAEGFGLVLIEAMAAGVPVVATDVAGIRDVVKYNETGLLVPPGNPTALAMAIRKIVDDPLLRQRLIDNGRKEVEQQFSWEAVLLKYEQLLGV